MRSSVYAVIIFFLIQFSNMLNADTELVVYDLRNFDYKSIRVDILKETEGIFYHIWHDYNSISECRVVSNDYKDLIHLIEHYVNLNKNITDEDISGIVLDNKSGRVLTVSMDFLFFFSESIGKIYNSVIDCKDTKLNSTKSKLLIVEKLSYLSGFLLNEDLRKKISFVVENALKNEKPIPIKNIGDKDITIISYFKCCLCRDRETNDFEHWYLDVIKFDYPVSKWVYIDKLVGKKKFSSMRCELSYEDSAKMNKMIDEILFPIDEISLNYIDFPSYFTNELRVILYDNQHNQILSFYGSNMEFAEGTERLYEVESYIMGKLICEKIESTDERSNITNLIEKIRERYAGIEWIEEYISHR